jgi:general secretion pathway protein N
MTVKLLISTLVVVTLAGLTYAGAQTIAPGQSTVADAHSEANPTAIDAAGPSMPTGNPLWSIALPTLTATREHPIFSPSRRPPAVIAPVTSAAVRVPTKVREPELIQLALVGTIVGDSEGFGVFVDNTTKSVVRLRAGDGYQGWTLRAVRNREATLEKDDQVKTLSLPRPSDDTAKATRRPQ